MTSRRGGYCSLSFLPATPVSWSWTLEGLFELTRRPLKALNLDLCLLLPELQRYKDTLSYGARTLSNTTVVNLDCKFVKKTLFTPILNCEKSTEYY